MAFCGGSSSGGSAPALGAGMASNGPATATASNSLSSSPGAGEPGPGIPLKPDSSVSGQSFYLDPKTGQALNGTGGGWRDAINSFVRSRMPAGVQGVLGAAGMAGMSTPGVNGADYSASRGNAPTTVAAGMATPGASIPMMRDPGASKYAQGGGGLHQMAGMAGGGTL